MKNGIFRIEWLKTTKVIMILGLVSILFLGCTGKKWNNGNLELGEFRANRVIVVYEEQVAASIDKAFQIASAIESPQWIYQWQPLLNYSNNEKNDLDTFWSESMLGAYLFSSPGSNTYWYTTLYDRDQHKFHAYLFHQDVILGKYELEMEEKGDGETLAKFKFTLTSVNERGNKVFRTGLRDRANKLTRFLGKSLKQYVETNTVFKSDVIKRDKTALPNLFQPKRFQLSYQGKSKGGLDENLALLGPVAELKWIDSWYFDLVYSNGGDNEPHAIFMTDLVGKSGYHRLNTYIHWYSTTYDKKNHRFYAILLTHGLGMTRVKFDLSDAGNGQTLWKIQSVRTGLSEEGNEIISNAGYETSDNPWIYLVTAANYYMETGKIYKIPLMTKLNLAYAILFD